MIPKLRFPLYSTPYTKSFYGEICTIKTGNKDTKDAVEGGNYPFFVRSQKPLSINSWSLDKEAIITAGDGVGVGKVFHYVEERFDYHQRVYALYDFKETIHTKYAFYHFSQFFGRRVYRLSAKNSVDSVRMDMIAKMAIAVPQYNEQLQVSKLLTAVDKKINLLTKKKEALETYKKGLMQKIFSQELRFKREDGADYPEWNCLSLKNVVSDFVVPMRDKPKEFNGEVDWCRIEDIENGFINGSMAALRVSNEVISSMNLKVLPIGSVIVSCSAYLGVCARVTKPLITNQTFIGLVPNDRVTTDFIYHLMTTKERILNKLSSGTTISYLSRSEFERLNIELPCLEEQKKISSTLNVADNSIISVESQIRTTQKLKKGLLQQMFV